MLIIEIGRLRDLKHQHLAGVFFLALTQDSSFTMKGRKKSYILFGLNFGFVKQKSMVLMIKMELINNINDLLKI